MKRNVYRFRMIRPPINLYLMITCVILFSDIVFPLELIALLSVGGQLSSIISALFLLRLISMLYVWWLSFCQSIALCVIQPQSCLS